MQETAYLIRSIRLINFHNFTDETIDLNDGGHLFLLGDNGCGKTTILDAVHYVLTAGMSMEWNSAARMSGSKRDGRRVQGIILRYNLDTGVMNKNGAISYVVLEIIGRHGKPLTIGMGMSTTSLDERIKFWGIIRECPLSDVQFLIEEDARLRPATRQEFKDSLGRSRGFINNQKNYRREIGDRLFGGEESYLDICRFLAMGKAYREISAGAADYHALFKRLLPEPRTAIFTQIIEALRTLDESQTILDDFERKLIWLQQLHSQIELIAHHREAMQRYDWLGGRFSIKTLSDEQQRVEGKVEQTRLHLLNSQGELAKLESLDRDLEERLDTLKTKDTGGLVMHEKRVQADIAKQKTILAKETEEFKKQNVSLTASEKLLTQQRDDFSKKMARFLPALTSHATRLPFSVGTLQQELDVIHRNHNDFLPRDFDIRGWLTQSDDRLHSVNLDLGRLLDKEQQLLEEIEKQEKRVDALHGQGEIYPDLPQYEECLQAMQQKMLTPKPLYLGLEWLQTVKKKQQQYIEECIGEDILATLFFRETDYPQARIVAVRYAGIRISRESKIAEDLPDWMRPVFDIQHSDPHCLRCLAMEMETSGLQPRISLVDGEPLLGFRGHERAMSGRSSRLIGGESRKQALAAEIRSIGKLLKDLARERRLLLSEKKELTEKQEILSAFKTFLQDEIQELQRISHKEQEARQQRNSFRELCRQQQHRSDESTRELNRLALLQKELADRISGAGLANLERRIKKLKNEKAKNGSLIQNINQRIGGDERDISQLQERLKAVGAKLKEFKESLKQIEEKLRQLLPNVDDIAHYVLKSKKGQQFKSREAIEKERTHSEVEAKSGSNMIREKVNDAEFGGAFRFLYEEKENKLYDYRQQSLPDIISHQSTTLAEQQEVISEDTRKLFNQIIMTDLLDYLRDHVGDLDRMVRRINRRLGERSFGGQRYRFRLRAINQFKRLIHIITKKTSFDPAAEKEMEAFFADNRDSIITTEAGSIPEELDYRNWYKYELEVSSIGEKGVVMDRRTKAIGSGGEQAVPNYLLILTIAHFMYRSRKIRLHTLLFDEAFYGIDAGRRDQLLGFATDLGLQLFIASPDQDGVRREVKHSTTLLVKKDTNFDVHLYPFHWQNRSKQQMDLFSKPEPEKEVAFEEEL